VELPKTKDRGKNSSYFYCKILHPQKIRISLEKKGTLLLSVFQRHELFSCSATEQINFYSIACWNTHGGDSHDASIGVVNTKTNFVFLLFFCGYLHVLTLLINYFILCIFIP